MIFFILLSSYYRDLIDFIDLVETVWLVPAELWIIPSLQPGHSTLPVHSVFKDYDFIFLCCTLYRDL